jgi:multiple sugar transport system substrate-binding protein
MRRNIILLSTAVLVVGILAACPPPTPEVVTVEVIKEVVVEKPVVETVEVEVLPPLTIIGPWSGAEAEPFMPVLEAFKEKTGIKTEYRIYRSEDLGTILPAMFEAEHALGDVILMAWPWWIKEKAEHLIEITDLTKGIEFVIDPAAVEGKVYGAPSYLWVKPGFWYRKSFFEEHGLKPPTTWEEFLALVDKLAEIPGIKNPIVTGDEVGWPISDVTEHFLATFGKPELISNLIEKKVKWTDPEVRAIFEERIVPLLEKEAFSDPIEWTSALEMWWKGEYGIYFMGNWITGMVEDPADLGVFTLPGAEGVVGGSDWMFIPKYSKRIGDAKKFIAFAISKEGMEVRAKGGGKLSSRPDISLDVYPPADRAVAEAAGKLKALPDLDDTIGGDWQPAFWDQLKLLWVKPEALDDVLTTLQEKMPE